MWGSGMGGSRHPDGFSYPMPPCFRLFGSEGKQIPQPPVFSNSPNEILTCVPQHNPRRALDSPSHRLLSRPECLPKRLGCPRRLC